MLDDRSGDGDGADGELVRQRAGHAGVDDDVRVIAQNHGLRTERGKDLADAADGGDDFLALDGAADETDAANGFGDRVVDKLPQALHFNVHSCDNANHTIPPARQCRL